MTKAEYNVLRKECLQSRCAYCGAKGLCGRLDALDTNSFEHVMPPVLPWGELPEDVRKAIGAV